MLCGSRGASYQDQRAPRSRRGGRGASGASKGKVGKGTPPPRGSSAERSRYGNCRVRAEHGQSEAVQDGWSQRPDPGRAGLRSRVQLGPPPPPESCPSPPPEPDFTPPPARARRNSHFAAADPAPTRAAATVTSRRRAAGPALRAATAPRETGKRPRATVALLVFRTLELCPGPHPANVFLHLPHRQLPSLPAVTPSSSSSQPKARAHEAPPFRGIPLSAKLLRSSALKVWGGLIPRKKRRSGLPTPETHSTRRTRRSQPTAGSPLAFPSLNSQSWASLGTAAAVTSAGRAGTMLPATSLPVPQWGRAGALPCQVRPRGHPEPEGRRGSQEFRSEEGAWRQREKRLRKK
ncbi:serine/arginine repetitive matrix protein 1-like [Aotus nancymaae]|uniref:serine/arginine repetitive matrix protein 1-like n=1 Tax=Aotus nancymaae TaxID=37293 RepID=UPI0030FE7533